ncbi:hypothetical protein BS47DRAFT_1287967, partial [Hydnum rufescens UP504]
LDPKHACSFNYTTVHDYFNKLKAVLEEHDIPWENIYNMDEKAVSLVVVAKVGTKNTFLGTILGSNTMFVMPTLSLSQLLSV